MNGTVPPCPTTRRSGRAVWPVGESWPSIRNSAVRLADSSLPRPEAECWRQAVPIVVTWCGACLCTYPWLNEYFSYFYFGALSQVLALRAFGIAEISAGVLIVLGLARRLVYPLLLAITVMTLLAVRKSVVDPWGRWLEGANVLFYPSLMIFAASLVPWSFREEDGITVLRSRARSA